MSIKIVVKLGNGIVMVFDGRGEQIPEYQGWYSEVREKVLRDAPADAVFAHGCTSDGKPQEVPRAGW
ncbi:MAG: hypothetical protein HY530_04535 [Chloroflexi bacterium]|nr:hypothetical protein [Chloroflexota bacterium]